MDPTSTSTGTIFMWEPIGPSEVVLLLAVIVALFGERIWRWVDGRRRRIQLRGVLVHSLENLKSDLVRIKDERNNPIEARTPIQFDTTSISEVGHYYHLFQDLVLPNLETMRLPRNSKTIEFFDHYKKNVETVKGKGYLTCATVNRLLERIDEAVDELS